MALFPAGGRTGEQYGALRRWDRSPSPSVSVMTLQLAGNVQVAGDLRELKIFKLVTQCTANPSSPSSEIPVCQLLFFPKVLSLKYIPGPSSLVFSKNDKHFPTPVPSCAFASISVVKGPLKDFVGVG